MNLKKMENNKCKLKKKWDHQEGLFQMEKECDFIKMQMNFFQVSSKNNIKYTTWVNVFSYFPGLTFALLLVKMSKSGFSKGNKRKQKKHTLCIKILVIFLAHYICHIQKPQIKNSVLTLLSRLSVLKQMNDSLLYCTGREYSSYFTRLLQSKKGIRKWIFLDPVQPHSKAKLAIDLRLFVY